MQYIPFVFCNSILKFKKLIKRLVKIRMDYIKFFFSIFRFYNKLKA